MHPARLELGSDPQPDCPGLRGNDQRPLPAEAFPKDPKLKAAADEYLCAAFRLERFGDGE